MLYLIKNKNHEMFYDTSLNVHLWSDSSDLTQKGGFLPFLRKRRIVRCPRIFWQITRTKKKDCVNLPSWQWITGCTWKQAAGMALRFIKTDVLHQVQRFSPRLHPEVSLLGDQVANFESLSRCWKASLCWFVRWRSLSLFSAYVLSFNRQIC